MMSTLVGERGAPRVISKLIRVLGRSGVMLDAWGDAGATRLA